MVKGPPRRYDVTVNVTTAQPPAEPEMQTDAPHDQPMPAPHDAAATETNTVEETNVVNANPSERLDPYTASVGFNYEDISGGAEECYGRVYDWFDPAGNLPSIRDWDFRPQFPEIDDHDWAQLFYEAFDRGETLLVAEVLEDEGLTEDEARQDAPLWQALMLGRIFGPRPPRPADSSSTEPNRNPRQR